jgi:hypothetical protein
MPKWLWFVGPVALGGIGAALLVWLPTIGPGVTSSSLGAPVVLHTVSSGASAAASHSSGCALQTGAYVSIGQSRLRGAIAVAAGTRVTGVSIVVDTEVAVTAAAFQACALGLPAFTGSPAGWRLVQLPVSGTERLAFPERSSVFNILARFGHGTER